MFTVAPATAVPFKVGVVLLPGEAGTLDSIVGVATSDAAEPVNTTPTVRAPSIAKSRRTRVMCRRR
jgi:hypothetical protein